MAILITSMNRHQHQNILSDFFRLRKRVFIDWLQWDLTTYGEEERDEFDHENAVYILTTTTDGRLSGGLRLLPTTEDYMFSVLFRQFFDGESPPCDSGIWELSRFAVDWSLYGNDRERISHVRTELGVALAEFCVVNDIFDILLLTSTRLESDCSEAVGAPSWRSKVLTMGKTECVALKYRISYPWLCEARKRIGCKVPSISQYDLLPNTLNELPTQAARIKSA